MTKKIQISGGRKPGDGSLLWRQDRPLMPEEIIAATARPNGWGPGTVRTLITRLLRKGALLGGRQEGGYFYRPLISRADYVRSESVRCCWTEVFRLEGEVAPLVAHLVTQQKLTAADYARSSKS